MADPFKSLQLQCRGRVITPSDGGYEKVRQVWNGSIQRRPAAILQCAGVADVVAGVRFAEERGLTLAVRAGGHSIAGLGTCEGGLVLDLRALQGIWVDPGSRRACADRHQLGDVRP